MNSNLLENRIGCYATDAGKFQIKKISRWALPEGCKRSSSQGGPSRKFSSDQA